MHPLSSACAHRLPTETNTEYKYASLRGSTALSVRAPRTGLIGAAVFRWPAAFGSAGSGAF